MMIRVMQTISDRGNGDCLKAVIASLLELPFDDVPHFMQHGGEWLNVFTKYMWDKGWKYKDYLRNCRRLGDCGEDLFKNLKDRPSVNGYYSALVLSPKFYDLEHLESYHAVIIDSDFNIVHDPYYPLGTKYPHADILKYNGVVGVDIFEKLT